MIKYFITSDIHSFYNEFCNALVKEGFDYYNPDHKLIICGDVFDRGKQAKELLRFLLGLDKLNKLILIRGNHEDLIEDCLNQLKTGVNISHHHWSNGTLDTIAQLSDDNQYNLVCGVYNYKDIEKKMKPYFKLMSKALDYYELDDYIFIHGWIPVETEGIHYCYNKNWRNASKKEWEKARWYNGMDMAHNKIIEPNKVIVCGHWNTGYGHYTYNNVGNSKYDCSDIYFNKGIIAIDACTAYSKKVNILVKEIQ